MNPGRDRRPEEINPEATEAVIANHPEQIKGVTLRIVGKLIASEGIAVVKTAQKTAKRFALPLMVDIGDRNRWIPPFLTSELLSLLGKGDILSHFCCHFLLTNKRDCFIVYYKTKLHTMNLSGTIHNA